MGCREEMVCSCMVSCIDADVFIKPEALQANKVDLSFSVLSPISLSRSSAEKKKDLNKLICKSLYCSVADKYFRGS